VLLGVQTLPVVEQRYADAFGGAALVPPLSELAVSGVLALAVLVAAVHLRERSLPVLARPLASWLWLESAAHAVVLRPTIALARLAARADDRVLDAAVDRTAVLVRRLADGAFRGDVRVVDGGVPAVADGARRLGALARRPQTGQVHQYYAQAAVALTVLFAVVLLIGT
jgi:NADH-quinone oxidoreductase subunit L